MVLVFRSFPVVVALLSASAAVAHPMVIHQGSLRWVGRELRMELTIDDHSMEHELAVAAPAATARSVARLLLSSIHIVGSDGARLECKSITGDESGHHVACAYEVPQEVGALALIHVSGEGVPPIARQFRLSRSLAGGSATRWIQLTSGENYEVILREESIEDGSSCRAYIAPNLCITANAERPEFRVQIDYPCRLLPRTPILAALREGAISQELLDLSMPALEEWVCPHFSAIGGVDGQPCAWSIENIALVAPSGAAVSRDDDRSYSAYLTRVRVLLRCRPASDAEWTDLTWTGFNADVLSIPFTCRLADASLLRGVLTPTQNRLRISSAVVPRVELLQTSPSLPLRSRPLRSGAVNAPSSTPSPARGTRDPSGPAREKGDRS